MKTAPPPSVDASAEPAGNSRSLPARFFTYVEIRTKIASLLPFLLGLGHVAWHYRRIDVPRTALFLVTMTVFDMTVTALNNYLDTRVNGLALPFERTHARSILLSLLGLATAGGILLASLTGAVVLFAGALCFAIGIAYTFGPLPISRLPLGEVFSGLIMGFCIPFLVVSIQAPGDLWISIRYAAPRIAVSVHLVNLLLLSVLAIAPICCIANLMLANNICDREPDRQVGRVTLPHLVGLKWALRLYATLYGVAYLGILASALSGALPVWSMLTLMSAPLVIRNIRRFQIRQEKATTFGYSVRNLVLIVLPPSVITLAIWILR